MNIHKRFEKWDIAKSFAMYKMVLHPGLTANFLTIQDWIPLEDPKKGDSFYGMDRSIDPSRLSGLRLKMDPNKDDLLDMFVQCQGLINREGGGSVDVALVPSKIKSLLKIDALYTLYGKLEILIEPSLQTDIFFISTESWRHIEHTGGAVCMSPSENLRLSWVETALKSCECGACKVGSSLHSPWCPIFKA